MGFMGVRLLVSPLVSLSRSPRCISTAVKASSNDELVTYLVKKVLNDSPNTNEIGLQDIRSLIEKKKATPAKSTGTQRKKAEKTTQLKAAEWKESQDECVARIDLPGLTKEDLVVSVDEKSPTVLVKVNLKQQSEDEEISSYRNRWKGGSGRFAFPKGAHVNLVKPKMEDGILTLSVPMVSTDSMKLISVM